ncbi:hypothetical protein O6H91_09G001200 [Diphasiastrum complanatum]|uniref:Uncharacterized protein n=1 Tax=Diphasiastrum complanatum TaxID=34168 RepID=A0ACC2CKQ5_DIPCM|nr:hypothetical protein O6H91_09G001200 [Diphasiastrum complanatum]
MLSAARICKGRFSQRLSSASHYSSASSSVDRYKLHSSLQSQVFSTNALFNLKTLGNTSLSRSFLLRLPADYCYLDLRTKLAAFPSHFIRRHSTSMSSNGSGAGSSGSNPTPPKFSIVSFLYKLIMGLLTFMYEVPSKLMSFVNDERSNVAKIEDMAAETVDKVAKSVEQAATTVEKVAEIVAEDARKTQDLMEKTESAMKKMEEVTDDSTNTDSKSSGQTSDSHATFPSKTAAVVATEHAQLDTNNLGTKKNTTTAISENNNATAPAAEVLVVHSHDSVVPDS